ncbi:MAG TPA: 3-deoxy-7-phosphoheptulonate synthase [Terriglobia bacterium]|nr:3-deoxy-7-phosphoheptulonate synthase [Terriglobia bacterium]
MRKHPGGWNLGEKLIPAQASLKQVGRHGHPEDTIVTVNDISVGGHEIIVMAGPCSVESEDQLIDTARAVKASGARILRGGAFKPRTSPYSFQGLKEEGLKLLAQARAETGLSIVTEVLDLRQLDLVCQYTDIVQIGSRSMQNFTLLEEAGKCGKPILLKRGMSSTIEEFLFSAEYVMKEGNFNVILCERGIRTFETSTRNTMDLNAVPMLKRISHLPVIVDPSHGTGHWWMVPYLSKAAVAVGADGLIVEVHPNPTDALSDGYQSLHPDRFDEMMHELRSVAAAVGALLREPAPVPV